jgi:hypothetical protein
MAAHPITPVAKLPDPPVERIDAFGNPMHHVVCPNCGKGEWITGLEYVGRKNAAQVGLNRDPDGACSRVCDLQLEHAKTLPLRGLR